MSETPLSRWVRALPLMVVGLSTLFYVYEFFLRVIPGAITHELMRDFNINAASLGLMTAGFYYAYTPMQIPAGLLCDRFGPRRVLTFAIFICSIATLLFASTTSLPLAALTRLLTGFASAFAFIGPLMLASRWFPPQRFALVAGVIQMMGCLGAIFGGTPVAILTEQLGWQTTLYWSALVGAVLTGLFWLVIRDKPYAGLPCYVKESDLKPPDDYKLSEMQRLNIVCRNPQTWWAAVAGFCCWAPIAIIAELWGIPFLMQLQHASATTASSAIIWTWAAIAIGSPLVGWWSNRINSRRIPLLVCFSIGLIASSALVLLKHHSWFSIDVILFCLGIAACAQPISFGLNYDNNPHSVSGTAVGFNNMAVIAGGSLLQPLVGILLQHNWNHTTLNGTPVYSVANYQHAFWLVPACTALGLLVSWCLVKETHCQAQHS